MNGPDLAAARAFLRLLGDSHSFQTFDDSKGKRPMLARILHGDLAHHGDALAKLNAQGAGVFVMVNAGDGKGRKTGNVRHVRALFLDLDGSPLAPVLAAPLKPNCTVESSPGRFHAYWCVSDCALSEFRTLQQALAARFAGDPKVCDLPRVMRLPGFDHRKAAPFRSRILTLHDVAPYTVAQVRAAFGFEVKPVNVVTLPVARATKPVERSARRTLPQTILEGERNAMLFSLACGLVRRGHDADAVNRRIQRVNAERCQPPICASEVDTLVSRAVGYGSDSFILLPHVLLDSSEWKAQPPAVHDVIVMAFRRWDGSENGFALIWEDFEGREGFGSKDTFVRHRKAATDAGFLVRIAEARSSQTGRKPDLFAIAHRWRFAKSENQTLRKVRNSDPYIDKHLRGDFMDRPTKRNRKTYKAEDAA